MNGFKIIGCRYIHVVFETLLVPQRSVKLRNIEILEKARKVRSLGLNCLDGIISSFGKDKAEQIMDLLLEANLLGFNLSDLNEIYSEWKSGTVQTQKTDTQSTQEIESVNTNLSAFDKQPILERLKRELSIEFDMDHFLNDYKNPNRNDDFLDVEDILLCLGLPPHISTGIMGGSHLTKELKLRGLEHIEERSNNSFNYSQRTHFKKSEELKEVVLTYLDKYLNTTKIETTPRYESLIDWMNRKYQILDADSLEISWTPLSERKIYTFILNEVQSVWVNSMFYCDKASDNLPCAFDQETVSKGELNTNIGVCDLIYRDTITKSIQEMATKDNDLLKYEGIIKKICENRNAPYTPKLADDIYTFITSLKVGGTKPKLVRSGLKPIHYLLVLVCANYYLSNKLS